MASRGKLIVSLISTDNEKTADGGKSCAAGKSNNKEKIGEPSNKKCFEADLNRTDKENTKSKTEYYECSLPSDTQIDNFDLNCHKDPDTRTEPISKEYIPMKSLVGIVVRNILRPI